MSKSNHSQRTEGQSRRVARIAVAVASLTFTAAGAAAQRPAQTSSRAEADARWLPWVGCWDRGTDRAAQTQLTCVRPAGGSSADLVTIVDGTVRVREHLVVDGQPHPIDQDGCTGSQTAAWAASGTRIYVGAAYSCAGNLRGRSTRLLAIVPGGVWLEVRDIHSGGGWVETVTRFHDAGLPAAVPADIRSEISHRELAIATARAAAAAPVNAIDIAEAIQSVDTAVVQSWLAARGQMLPGDSARVVVAQQQNLAKVYYGTPPAPAAPAPAAQQPAMPCDAFGCYEPNMYSDYNAPMYTPYGHQYGYPYYGYNPYYGYGSSYYLPYLAPVVVSGNGRLDGHVNGRGNPRGGRPGGMIHTPNGFQPPGGRGPGVHGPVGQNPRGAAPGTQSPSTSPPAGQTPRIMGLPSRARP